MFIVPYAAISVQGEWEGGGGRGEGGGGRGRFVLGGREGGKVCIGGVGACPMARRVVEDTHPLHTPPQNKSLCLLFIGEFSVGNQVLQRPHHHKTAVALAFTNRQSVTLVSSQSSPTYSGVVWLATPPTSTLLVSLPV